MCEAWSRASNLACSWIGHFSMRRLDLEGPQTGQAASSQEFSNHSGDKTAACSECCVCAGVGLARAWRLRLRWRWCCGWSGRLWKACACGSSPSKDTGESLNGEPCPAPAAGGTPAALTSQGSMSHEGITDTAQNSTMTTDEPMGSNRPGQPGNPVSLPAQRPGRPERQGSTPKEVPGPSYESDDEGDGQARAKARLNDITHSVRGHANAAAAGTADDNGRRQAEKAVKHLAAERGLPTHTDPMQQTPGSLPAKLGVSKAAVASDATPDLATRAQPAAATTPPLAALGTVGGTASSPAVVDAFTGGTEGTSAPGKGVYDIDLDIDLTKGLLKVDYSARGLLGQGGFAAVYKGRYKGQQVAVKMIKKTAGSSLAELQEDMNALMHELHILRQVNHPNIVTLFGGCLKPPHIFLVEERMEGTLDFYIHHVRKQDTLSVREVVYFALDIGCGLSYLHPSIVHRDLKPANVLLSREGRCKISDFGLARTKIKEYLSTKNLDAGTTAYIAPECFMCMDNPDMHDLRRSVTDRTDIYALGIIMWEMLAGKRPWQGLKPLLVAYQVAYRSLRPPIFELGNACPKRLRLLIEECWCQEPKQRPSSQQVVDRLLEVLNELPTEEEFGYAQQDAPAAAPLPQTAAGLSPHAVGPLPPAVTEVVSPHDVVLRGR